MPSCTRRDRGSTSTFGRRNGGWKMLSRIAEWIAANRCSRETYQFDPTRRQQITGPCQVTWRDGIRRTREALHPEHVKPVTGVRPAAPDPRNS
jgi:hypothetical protein